MDMGNYIMTFLNISFVLLFVWIGYLLSENLKHGTYSNGTKQCGPFNNKTAWRDSFGTKADSIYNDYYPVLWLILVIVLAIYFLKRNTSVIVNEYAKEKDKEYKEAMNNLERSIARVKHKIELKKMVEEA